MHSGLPDSAAYRHLRLAALKLRQRARKLRIRALELLVKQVKRLRGLKLLVKQVKYNGSDRYNSTAVIPGHKTNRTLDSYGYFLACCQHLKMYSAQQFFLWKM
jgi:hypothetical protein